MVEKTRGSGKGRHGKAKRVRDGSDMPEVIFVGVAQSACHNHEYPNMECSMAWNPKTTVDHR